MLFVLTGPESTAKSDLTYALSEHFGARSVAEAARRYLTGSAPYQPSDLLEIARLQVEAERQTEAELVFADTDLQVIHIWWQERFGPVPHALAAAYRGQRQRYYLLCAPDLPWVPDPLRENPQDRDRLFALYEADLKHRGAAYKVVSGSGEARVACAVAIVNEVLQAP